VSAFWSIKVECVCFAIMVVVLDRLEDQSHVDTWHHLPCLRVCLWVWRVRE